MQSGKGQTEATESACNLVGAAKLVGQGSCLEILSELHSCQSTLRPDKLGQFYAASRPQKLTFITWPPLWALAWSQVGPDQPRQRPTKPGQARDINY